MPLAEHGRTERHHFAVEGLGAPAVIGQGRREPRHGDAAGEHRGGRHGSTVARNRSIGVTARFTHSTRTAHKVDVVKPIRKFTVRAVVPGSLSALEELAGNLRWSWHEPTRRLFEHIDPELWRTCERDPIAFLGEVDPGAARRRWRQTAATSSGPSVSVRDCASTCRSRAGTSRSALGRRRTIAYFSPEFGIAAALPQYSGGLGILAGDHLKAASDLGVPIIGVGLFYRAGYFSQSISPDGWQQETLPRARPRRPAALGAAQPRRHARADHARAARRRAPARADLAGVAVGRITLLLLDTDIPENTDELRTVTDRLYGGGGEHRLLQELLLGIGGVRAVRAFTALSGTPAPEVFHTNEGHAGFLGLERIATYIGEGLTFAEALQLVRAGTVFTTHTPVPAGIDRFERGLVERYFTSSTAARRRAGRRARPRRRARRRPGDERVQHGGHGPAARAARQRRLEAARRGQPAHVRRALARVRRRRGADHLGHQRRARADLDRRGPARRSPNRRSARATPTHADWRIPARQRRRALERARPHARCSSSMTPAAASPRPGASRTRAPRRPGGISNVLDPDVLTIGFARRVPTYKRLTLMLHDPERLRSILLRTPSGRCRS